MIYPDQSRELIQLLADDQVEKRELGRAYFHSIDNALYKAKKEALTSNTRRRVSRMLQILDKIGEPSISNIGMESAQAISVLALHDTVDTLRKVLAAFTSLYKHSPADTYYQAIPSMTDFLLILERKPQRFGTQWLFDKNKEPFLPIVDNFEHVNERRKQFGIEPLRWPKSLAIPLSEQPWLERPLSELIMRDPTDDEYKDFAGK
jgi:hypothetical protein